MLTQLHVSVEATQSICFFSVSVEMERSQSRDRGRESPNHRFRNREHKVHADTRDAHCAIGYWCFSDMLALPLRSRPSALPSFVIILTPISLVTDTLFYFWKASQASPSASMNFLSGLPGLRVEVLFFSHPRKIHPFV